MLKPLTFEVWRLAAVSHSENCEQHTAVIGERFVELHEHSACIILKMLTLSLRFGHHCGILKSHLILLFIGLPSLPEHMDFLYCTQSNIVYPSALS